MHTPRTAHTARRHWTRTPKAWIAGACASVILGGMGAVALSDPRIPTYPVEQTIPAADPQEAPARP